MDTSTNEEIQEIERRLEIALCADRLEELRNGTIPPIKVKTDVNDVDYRRLYLLVFNGISNALRTSTTHTALAMTLADLQKKAENIFCGREQ